MKAKDFVVLSARERNLQLSLISRLMSWREVGVSSDLRMPELEAVGRRLSTRPHYLPLSSNTYDVC